VPYYAAGGCNGCAAAAGAVVGATAGVVVASADVTATANGVANPGMAAPVTYVMGANYAKVPSGCATPSVQGQKYYLCGNTWFQPTYGANGLYYRVTPTP